MTLTVRTDLKVSEALSAYALHTGQTKSDVVKQALNEFLAKHSRPAPSPWELVQDLLPTEINPALPADLSTRRKEYLSAILEEKHARRRGPASRSV
jgi:hypothetical protein